MLDKYKHMTWDERLALYQQKTRHASDIADRVKAMRWARISKLCTLAGLDGSIWPIHLNNYFCSCEYGHPWIEVNNSLARQAQRLADNLWQAHDLARALHSRLYKELLTD